MLLQKTHASRGVRSEHGAVEALDPAARRSVRRLRAGREAAARPPERKFSTAAHTKRLGWYVDLEFRGDATVRDKRRETREETREKTEEEKRKRGTRDDKRS